jgi:hypothetical protein
MLKYSIIALLANVYRSMDWNERRNQQLASEAGLVPVVKACTKYSDQRTGDTGLKIYADRRADAVCSGLSGNHDANYVPVLVRSRA